MLLLGAIPGTAAAFNLFSIREPVYAMVGEVLLAGEAIGHWDRAGTLAVHSTQDDSLGCTGDFHFTGLKKGVAHIHCTDGSNVDLEFEGLGPLSGFGQGPTPRGTVSFTFGLTPDEAAPYLHLPAGKRIALTRQGPKLQDL
jgi:hypothetical protein